MAFLILANALMGLMIALLYYPDSPAYLFGPAKLEELWLWSKYQAFIGSLLFIFALLAVDTNIRGRELARSLSTFTAVLQGLLSIFPAVMYFVFLRGAISAQLTVRGTPIVISSRELIFHLLVLLVAWATAAWLAFGTRSKELSSKARAIDGSSFIGDGI